MACVLNAFGRRESNILILWVGILFSLPLFFCGYPWGTHDGWIQQIWQECFSRQFWDGELYPRWLPEPNQGFGGATYFFYPPLPYWVGSIFWGITSVCVLPVSLTLGWSAALAFILSGFSMRYCLRQFTNTEWFAAVGAVVYMVAPYHLAIDLLDRGAHAEFWAFLWLPLIVGNMQRFGKSDSAKEKRQVILYLAFSLTALIMTHLPTTVTFAPFILGFALFLGKKGYNATMLSGLLSLGFSAAYWVPAFFLRVYTKGASDQSFNGAGMEGTFFFPTLDWQIPLFTNDVFNRRLLYIFLGMVIIWGALYLSILLFPRTDEQRNKRSDLLFWSLMMGICLLFMTPCTNLIYEWVPGFKNIQFSWRFLGCATFMSCLLLCFVLEVFWRKPLQQDGTNSLIPFSVAKLWAGRSLGSVILLVMLGTAGVLGWVKYQDAFWDMEAGMLRTPPTSIDVYDRNAWAEYDPVAANLKEAQGFFPEDIRTGNKWEPRFKETGGTLKVFTRGARHWELECQTDTEQSLLLPQYWFPGWEAKSGTQILSVGPEVRSGLIQINIPPGRHQITLRLRPLWPEWTGLYLSLITLAMTGLYALLLIKKTYGSQRHHT